MVKDSAYLGKILRNKNELKPETVKKITNANRSYYALLLLRKSQSVLRAEKKISKPLIRPVAADGAQSWTLEIDIAKRLATSRLHVTAKVFQIFDYG